MGSLREREHQDEQRLDAVEGGQDGVPAEEALGALLASGAVPTRR